MKGLRKILKLALVLAIPLLIAGGYVLHLAKIGAYQYHRSYFKYWFNNSEELEANKEMADASAAKVVKLILSEGNFNKIATQRDHAYTWSSFLSDYPLVTWPEDLEREIIEGSLVYNGDTFSLTTRMAGRYYDHFREPDRWSFRIMLDDGVRIKNIQELNLMVPLTRNYMVDVVGHAMLKDQDLITIQHEYVHLFLNEKDLGIYYMEEYFEDETPMSNGLFEGIIIRLNEDFEIKLIDRIFKHPVYETQRNHIEQKLKQFKKGSLPVDSIIDFEKFAKRLAISAIMGDWHSFIHFNLYYYFNPNTGLLEPSGREWQLVPFNNEMDMEDWKAKILGKSPLYKALFNSDAFRAEFKKQLISISNPEAIEKFFLSNNTAFDSNLKILYSQYPYVTLNEDLIKRNAEIVFSATSK